MTEVHTASAAQTEALATRLCAALSSRERAFIALFGEMGVGKTAFTRGFCRGLGIAGVHSPTFTVVNEYHTGTRPVYHFDFYRVEEEDELLSIGFDEYLQKDGFCLSEWSENVTDFLPEDAVRVTLSRTDGGDGRCLRFTGLTGAEECALCAVGQASGKETK